MGRATLRRPRIHTVRLFLLVVCNGDAPATELNRHGHHRVSRLGEWRMVVIGRRRFWLSQIGHVDDMEAAMPAARPHFICKTKRVMQAVALEIGRASCRESVGSERADCVWSE